MKIIWTLEEDEFLRNNLDKKDSELGKILNRSPSAVCCRRKLLNLRKEVGDWSEEQLRLLKELWKDKTDRELIPIINKSRKKISSMRCRLNLIRRKHGEKWTSDEINLLREKWVKSSPKELSTLFPNRKYAGIKGEAQLLKLRKEEFWTEKQIVLLREIYPIKSWEIILKKLGKSQGAIRAKANQLGLKRKDPTRWTLEEIEKLKEVYSTKSWKELLETFPNRPIDGIKSKALDLGLKRTLSWSKTVGQKTTAWLTKEQYSWIRKQGCISEVIRSLIEGDMKRCKD